MLVMGGGVEIDVYRCCIWDFCNSTSWIFVQVFLFNVKSWECRKGFICSEWLKGKWLNHAISPHMKAKFHSARIWHVASFCTFSSFLETGGILGPNLTKLGLLSGLHICMIRPLCIKSAVDTPWQLHSVFCFAPFWNYKVMTRSQLEAVTGRLSSSGVQDRNDLTGGGFQCSLCKSWRRRWIVRKAGYNCLYTNKSQLKDQFVISQPCLDWGFALITGMGWGEVGAA